MYNIHRSSPEKDVKVYRRVSVGVVGMCIIYVSWVVGVGVGVRLFLWIPLVLPSWVTCVRRKKEK